MSLNLKFFVEDKIFEIPETHTDIDSFIVKSVPKAYAVTIENNPQPVKQIQELMNRNPKNLLFIDKNVFDLYCCELNIDKSRIFIAEATENFKTLDGFVDLIAFLEKNEFTKSEKLVVVGGGIIQDIGAFAGACYKRGINWVFYPTTLLSMCDSCIGGKSGINHNKAKNQLALFSAPSQVVINTYFLNTLHQNEIVSGLGEILKLLTTGHRKYIEIYQNLIENGKVKSFDSFKPLILGALGIKKAIVEEDEFELYHRKSLNYGHTIGHAIEILSNYEIPHGQAVIIGMVIVNKFAYDRGLLNKEDYELIKKLSLDLLSPSILKNTRLDGIEKLLKKDKKTEGNLVNFVIIESIGKIKFLKIELNDGLINEIKNIFTKEFQL